MSGADLEDLLRRAAAGDRQAAGKLARRYEAPLRAAIHRRLGPDLHAKVDTDDIFQSTIFESVQDLGGFRYRGEQAFLGWLTTLAERRIRDKARYHRAGKRDQRREHPLPAESELAGERTTPTQGAVRAELTEQLREAMAQLPDADRQIVELHSFQGLGFKEVAERLGLADKNAARYAFQRALNRIEELLEPGSDQRHT
ncbi:MAG: sigma-70 family RNA polymerase sigma factor [Planctomycetota bacterium]|jgi:RNA polymerase sigma-70 factor (ECF subfamily)